MQIKFLKFDFESDFFLMDTAKLELTSKCINILHLHTMKN